MKKIIVLILVVAMVVAGCSNKETTKPVEVDSGVQNTDKNVTETSEVERKEYYDVYGAELSSLNYLAKSTSDLTALMYNTVDALIDYDVYGILKDNAATSWECSEDGLTWTFKIREGVKWYTNEGKEYADVTANDFVYAIKYILDKNNASSTANIVYDKLENAKAYYDGEITDFEKVGVKALDTYTLQYKLKEPVPYFLRALTYTCWLPACEKFIDEVGAENFGTGNDMILYDGSHLLTEFEPENRRVLKLNENYWDKDHIYISKMVYTYNKEASTMAPELFLRGEVTRADIPITILDEWMNDPKKKEMIHKTPLNTQSYQLEFNFDPRYEDEYGPDNWKIAVNNINFRKAIYHSVDRMAIATTIQPYEPEAIISRTSNLPGLMIANGVDYTQFDGIKEITNNDSFDKEKAVEYKKKAMEELKGKVDFPVKVVMPHKSTQADGNKAQVIEQHIEEILGTDFVDVILIPYPPTNYTTETSGAGKFSLMEIGWGADYADPLTYFEIFMSTTSIGPKRGKVYMAEECKDSEGKSILEAMINKADAEKLDITKRYQLFADAEKYLLDNALTIPIYRSGGTYEASYVDPFSGNCINFGRRLNKMKGKIILDKSLSMDEYAQAEKEYNAKCAEELKKLNK